MELLDLDLERRWPELFEDMDATQRRTIVQAFTEGATPEYEDVRDLCQLATGAISEIEYDERTTAQERARQGQEY